MTSVEKCVPCEGQAAALNLTQVKEQMKTLIGWSLDAENFRLKKDFHFKNFHRVMAFVNAVAWISHQSNHHPEMSISYNRVQIAYYTHSLNALSQNDFICARAIDALGIS
jgi:4a-hydroxytetrahydrobiopterin dehydratase